MFFFSELMTPFQWDVQEPFSIEPASGTLKPFGTAKMTVYFRPTVSYMTIYFLFSTYYCCRYDGIIGKLLGTVASHYLCTKSNNCQLTEIEKLYLRQCRSYHKLSLQYPTRLTLHMAAVFFVVGCIGISVSSKVFTWHQSGFSGYHYSGRHW